MLINAKVISNDSIGGVYSMRLNAPEIAESTAPGQFVDLYTTKESLLLPRPISICDADGATGELRLVFQVAGNGTEFFSQLKQGDSVKLCGVLGNGFSVTKHGSYALVGGGVGVPPLLYLARKLRETYKEAKIVAYLGFRSGEFLTEDFKKLGVEAYVATDDGSVGFKGSVISLMKEKNIAADIIYSCGPKAMLRALAGYAQSTGTECHVSMEERMACGIGACVGCVIKIKSAEDGFIYKKVCKDGPVFNAKEVVWDA